MKKTFFFLALLLMVMISVGSCQQESKDVQPTFSDYLSINHEINYSKLSKSEQQIIYEAFKRLTFVETGDGMMEIKQRSGAEVNISENIYNFFDKIVRGTNLKTRALEDSCGDGGSGNDCVIQSIYGILNDMGITNVSTDDIEKKLTQSGLYDSSEGVSNSNMEAALKTYFNVVQITNVSKNLTIPVNSGNYFVIRKSPNDNGGLDYHAETLISAANGKFYSRNDHAVAEADTAQYGIYGDSEIEQLYKLSR